MYCAMCGKQISDQAVICVHCGCSTKDDPIVVQDAPNAGFAVLGFLFPIVGLILWLVYQDTKPLKAKSAGKGALVSFILSLIMGFILGIIVAL